MKTDDVQAFRGKLAQAGFEEHFDNGSDSPEYTWVEGWADGKCLWVKCYRRGVEVEPATRLADQATRAKAEGKIEDKDIPEELKRR